MPGNAILIMLGQTVPGWMSFPRTTDVSLSGFAAPSGSIWRKGGLDITIRRRGNSASVQETQPARLPSWCPELHLNSDRTFCQGLEQLAIRTVNDAHQWWADLEIHLRLLSVALKTGVWPQHSALDHGRAGALQREARRLARELNLVEEYARAHAGMNSWIADPEFTLISADGAFGLSSWKCVCGCNRSIRRCNNRQKIKLLVLTERSRRLELARFWNGIEGRECCRKIRNCPLATGEKVTYDPQLLAKTYRALGQSPSF